MSRLLFFIPLVIFIVSCSYRTSDKKRVAATQDTLALPTDSATFYFPIDSTQGKLHQERSLDSFVNSWYSHMLFAMREPVLYNHSGETEIYRFTWLRSFDNPVAIRVQKQGNNVSLFAKVTNGAGGYEAGQIKLDTVFNVSEQQWRELKALVERTEFWHLPSRVDDHGKDGAEWILEGVRNKQYHWVERWSPTTERHAEFRAVCEYLLNLSKVPIYSNRGYY